MQDGPRFLTAGDLNTYSATQSDWLGAQGVTGDGRKFRYVKFGGTSTIYPSFLLVSAAAPANSTGLAITATQPGTGTSASALAAGSLSFNVTNGATSVTANQFDYVEIINDENNEAYNLRLGGHNSGGSGATITLRLQDPIPQNATTLVAGDDTVNLRYSPWNIPAISATQALPVGIVNNVVPNSSTVTNYGWVQTSGPAYVYAPNSGTKGYPAVQDLSTAGGVAVIGAGAAETVPQIGIYKESAASSQASVYLTID